MLKLRSVKSIVIPAAKTGIVIIKRIVVTYKVQIKRGNLSQNIVGFRKLIIVHKVI